MDATALVIFTDIRGFTSWARDTEVFARLNEFVDKFLALVRKHFPEPAFIKGLGDGAMIVQEIDEPTSAKAYAKLLATTLRTIQATEQDFGTLCETFAQKVGQKTELRLGWGIVRGPVKKFPNDYVGPNVNKAARLCDVARPFGIVVDASDFTDKPQLGNYRFERQTRKLSGAGEVEVWVTVEIVNKFVAREKLRQAPEVHVAGTCIDTSLKKTVKLLIARRSPTRTLYPNLLEGCGGQLARSETFADGVKRHFRLELGLEVRVLEDIHCFYQIILPDEPLIPGIRFLCELVGEAPEKIESMGHSELRWVSESDFKRIPADQFISGLKDEVLGLLERHKKGRK
jgi:class 3 adenylate cyclase